MHPNKSGWYISCVLAVIQILNVTLPLTLQEQNWKCHTSCLKENKKYTCRIFLLEATLSFLLLWIRGLEGLVCVQVLKALTPVSKARGRRRWDEEDNWRMSHYLVIRVVPQLFHVRSNCKSSQASWHSCPSDVYMPAVQNTRSFSNATGTIAVCRDLQPVSAIIYSQAGNTAAHFITTGRPSACLEMWATAWVSRKERVY